MFATNEMPVEVYAGKNCVTENRDCFALGKRALLVTGRHGAKACGAQDDVSAVLSSLGIEFSVFDEIGENPLLSVCWKAGQTAAKEGADFIIGIGGGSAMDAAKAAAAFAANPGLAPEALFTAERKPSYPIILIPTTAGTGSEANPYAVMTLDDSNKKKTFSDRGCSFAKYAFLDARYTESLSPRYTESCAMDAFAHCAESYLSPKADEHSKKLAVEGAGVLYAFLCRENRDTPVSFEEREALLLASCKAGAAINRTGTGFPHPLGYNLTLSYGIPHGFACGAFYREYLSYNEKAAPELCRSFYEAIGTDGEELKTVIPEKAGVKLCLTDAEISAFVEKVKGAGNYKNSPYVINEQEMALIYRTLFGEK